MEKDEKAILLGKKITGLRDSRGLSIRKLSKIIGISDTALAKIESASTKSITIDLGESISKALGISFNELFGIEINDSHNLIAEENRTLKKRIQELESQLEDKRQLEDYFKRDVFEMKSFILNLPMDYYFEYERITKNLANRREISDDEYNKRIIEIQKQTAQLIAILVKNKFYLLDEFEKVYTDDDLKEIIEKVKEILNK